MPNPQFLVRAGSLLGPRLRLGLCGAIALALLIGLLNPGTQLCAQPNFFAPPPAPTVNPAQPVPGPATPGAIIPFTGQAQFGPAVTNSTSTNPAVTAPISPRPSSTTISIDPNYQNNILNSTNLQAAPTLAAWGEFTNAQILARIGGESILAGDLLGMVTKILEPHKAQLTAEQYEQEKQKLMKQVLEQMIEGKMVFADALLKLPKENLEKMQTAVNEQFEKGIVKGMFEKYKVSSRKELEQKLAENGSSLDRQQRMFFERSVALQWMKQNIRIIDDVPLSDVLAYYKNNQATYEFKAQVRWEELMVEFARIPDKNQAMNTLGEWGNRVLQGQPFGAVAKQFSHGATAYKEGQYDWTTEGSLIFKKVDQAIHTLPVGKMSQIIEDDQGLHIVRVLERKPAGRVPFEEAQPEIRKKLIEEAQKKLEDEYLVKVRQRVPVWTIFDGQVNTAELNIRTNASR